MSSRRFGAVLGVLALGAVGACVNGSGGSTVGLPTLTGGEEPGATSPEPAGGGYESPGSSGYEPGAAGGCLVCTTYTCTSDQINVTIGGGSSSGSSSGGPPSNGGTSNGGTQPSPSTQTSVIALTPAAGGCAYDASGSKAIFRCDGTVVVVEDDGGATLGELNWTSVPGGGFSVTSSSTFGNVSETATTTCVPGGTVSSSSSGGSASGSSSGTVSGGGTQCVAKNGVCTTNNECCSGNCQTNTQSSNFLTCL